uniref:Rab-GAP TBC domain-containing protein n=1 Tax=Angiostrongylus cantonensis TaxID=6313 RepID=A0A0K0D2X0_ANGCA
LQRYLMKSNAWRFPQGLINAESFILLLVDCRKLAVLLENKKSVPELESFMTLYCKKRNVDYKKDIGWLVVLEKILKLDLPTEHLFNVFFAFTTKYIPKFTKENAQIYDLFRLLLQYHDPQISCHLDSLKCNPYSYANQWFSTVLAASVDDSVCRTLWESYIEKGDPFLIFYMALVLIVNARDQLLEIDPSKRDMAREILISLPSQLTVDDVPDFVQLSAYYADRTPQCVRENLHYLIFGANYDDDVGEMQVSKLLCLPVTVQELIRKEHGAVRVRFRFLISSVVRMASIYTWSSLFYEFNTVLNATVLVKETHCLLYKNKLISLYIDSCHLQDKFMNMLIARFLRNGKRHVTFAQGGYRGLHNILVESNRLRLINSHDELKCRECRFTSAASTEQAEFIERFPCHELNENKDMIPSHIAITPQQFIIVFPPGYVTTEARHALPSVLRVTCRKKVPELLTFKFGYEIYGVPKITAVHRFLVPKAGECAKSVKTAIFALRPLSDWEATEVNCATINDDDKVN